MAHLFHSHSEHRHGRSRAHHILKGSGHKRGGAAHHADAAADRKLFRSMMAEQQDGSAVPGAKRGGRYARGGRTRKADKGGHHTNIAVVVPQGKPGGAPGGPPVPPMPPLAGGPPPPGIGGPPPGLPPGPMGPKPPGMMKRGGRIKRAE